VAGGAPVLALPPPPPQPAHIKASTVAAVRASHVGRLRRPAIIPRRARTRKVVSQGKLNCKRNETGSAGIDFGTGGKATAAVATLIVAVTGVVPVKGKEAGVAVQFAPVGAPEHASVTVPLKPPSGVKMSD
jgi:hypothetical protein